MTPQTMPQFVFYSWQSDIAARACRTLIGDALESATTTIESDETVTVEPVVDRDTEGVAGSPDIVATIFSKIERAEAFVADVTPVGQLTESKTSPNPNVLIELGYALKTLGHERVILVQNTSFGSPDALPFDLRQKRVVTYHSEIDASSRVASRRELSAKLERALRGIFALGACSKTELALTPTLDHVTTRRESEVHEYCLHAAVKNEGLRRVDDWEIEVEFPTQLLKGCSQSHPAVAARSNDERTLFRTGVADTGPIRVGDSVVLKVNYRIDNDIYWSRKKLFSESADFRVMVDGVQVSSMGRLIKDLNNF